MNQSTMAGCSLFVVHCLQAKQALTERERETVLYLKPRYCHPYHRRDTSRLWICYLHTSCAGYQEAWQRSRLEGTSQQAFLKVPRLTKRVGENRYQERQDGRPVQLVTMMSISSLTTGSPLASIYVLFILSTKIGRGNGSFVTIGRSANCGWNYKLLPRTVKTKTTTSPPVLLPAPSCAKPTTGKAGQSLLTAAAANGESSSTTSSAPKTSAAVKKEKNLTPEQLDFAMGYLNKHHRDLLVSLTDAFSPLGAECAKANVWSGGSYEIADAKIVDIDFPKREMKLDVTIQKRNKPEEHQVVVVSLDAMPIPEKSRQVQKLSPVPTPDDDDPTDQRSPIDDLVRRLSRLCNMVGKPEVTGKLIQLAIQVGGTCVFFYGEIGYASSCIILEGMRAKARHSPFL